jgi:hypothetical protein
MLAPGSQLHLAVQIGRPGTGRKNLIDGLRTLPGASRVPKAVGHSKHDRSFAGSMESEKRSHDSLNSWPTVISHLTAIPVILWTLSLRIEGADR